MFIITGFYHRYFSHKSFKTSRTVQFIAALFGTMNLQYGPIWWSAHHRKHHAESDQADDVHSPFIWGFFWSHMGWFLTKENKKINTNCASDLKRYPEIVFLDTHDWIGAFVLASVCLCISYITSISISDFWSTFLWLYFVNTVLVYHATYTINSLAHRWGKRLFPTKDKSRNNFALAILTMGEGWHNNHHFYPRSVKQGFTPSQIDLTYYILKGLESLGIIWDLRYPPKNIKSKMIKR